MLSRTKRLMPILAFAVATGTIADVGSTDVNRVVGVNVAGGKVAFVKSFFVSEGSEISGIEFVGNDLNSVMPRVSLFQGPLVSLVDGQRLVSKEGIRHDNDRHRVRVTFNPILVQATSTFYVAVELPPSTGPSAVGTGAGLGGQASEELVGSFIAFNEHAPLMPLHLDLAIDLVLQRRAGKAGTSDPGDGSDTPARTFLAARSPSPSPAIAVEFGIREQGIVDLSIYDVRGRRVRSLVRGELSPGVHTQPWDGLDAAGRQVASGIYLVKLRAGGEVFTQKLVVAK